MTLSSDLDRLYNSNGAQFKKFLQTFEHIIDILEQFEDNYEKKLNFTKLVNIFNIPPNYTQELASFLVTAQNVFGKVFKNHHLKKRKEGSTIYLITEKQIPNKIIFTLTQIKLFNDLIYTFQRVKRGKGFDLSRNGTELLSNLKSLESEHPYLFEKKDNGLIYPSAFGMKLGDLIISYNTGNKEIKELTVDEINIVVRPGE